MSRWNAYGQLDSKLMPDGDARFVGLDMTRDRPLLGPGMLARAENKRLRIGSAATRLGNIQVPEFAPGFTNKLIGSEIYSNPNGDEVMLVAEAKTSDPSHGNQAYVWALQYGKDPYKVYLAAGETLDVAAVEFVQAFEKVILLRRPSPSLKPLVWDGDKTHTFDPVVKPTGAFEVIPPNAQPGPGYTSGNWHGVGFQSRVIYYNAQYPALPWSYQFIMSDVLEYAGYDPAKNSFQINAGESDWITRIWPWFQGRAVVFKRRSTHMADNFADDPTLMTQRQLSKRIGLCANKCVIEWGSDLAFLSEPGGIYRLGEVIQEQISTEPLPVSEPIQSVINRIHWPDAEAWACAQALAEYGYFAVPLDDTIGGNNAVMVLNLNNGQWESIDFWNDPTFLIHALHVTNFGAGRAVYGVDYLNKRVYALYQQQAFDEINDDSFPITDVMETRGYTCGDPSSFKRYARAGAVLRTYDPFIKVSAISDGYNELKDLTPNPITKDRLKFYPHGSADFDPTQDDPDLPKREDYSPVGLLDNFVGEDYELVPIGLVDGIPASPAPAPGPLQDCRQPLSVRVNARWVSLRIENASGVCDVLATGVEATPSSMETKTAA